MSYVLARSFKYGLIIEFLIKQAGIFFGLLMFNPGGEHLSALNIKLAGLLLVYRCIFFCFTIDDDVAVIE